MSLWGYWIYPTETVHLFRRQKMSLKSRTRLRNCTTVYFISIWFGWQGWLESPLMCALATALVALVRKLARKTWARLLGTGWLVGPFSRKRSDNGRNVGVRIPNPKISVCGLTEFVNYSHEIWSSVMILCKYVFASDVSPLSPDKGEEQKSLDENQVTLSRPFLPLLVFTKRSEVIVIWAKQL